MQQYVLRIIQYVDSPEILKVKRFQQLLNDNNVYIIDDVWYNRKKSIVYTRRRRKTRGKEKEPGSQRQSPGC